MINMKINNDEKNIKKKIKTINNLKIRQLSNKLRETLNLKDYIFGGYYQIIHYFFMFFIIFIFIFSNNILYLVILLNILAIDTFSIVVFHDCPLSLLEKKYLGISSSEHRIYSIKNCNIMYTNNKVYDLTLDILINAWSLIALKILFIIFLNLFGYSKFIKKM
jgi:hypothetical protein